MVSTGTKYDISFGSTYCIANCMVSNYPLCHSSYQLAFAYSPHKVEEGYGV